MNHFAIDILKLGPSFDSAIVTIAAQQFDLDKGKLGKLAIKRVLLDSALKPGAVGMDQFRWFVNHDSREIVRALFHPHNAVTLPVALDEIRSFILTGSDPAYLWGWRGHATFATLEYAYRKGAVALTPPWEGWHDNIRCAGTLGMLAGQVPSDARYADYSADPGERATSLARYIIAAKALLSSAKMARVVRFYELADGTMVERYEDERPANSREVSETAYRKWVDDQDI